MYIITAKQLNCNNSIFEFVSTNRRIFNLVVIKAAVLVSRARKLSVQNQLKTTFFLYYLYTGVISAECQLRSVKPSPQFRIPHSEFRILSTHLRVCALYLVPKTAENTRISVQKKHKKFLHFSQSFFRKIVDIYQSIWYHNQACECGFGYNSVFTQPQDMR